MKGKKRWEKRGKGGGKSERKVRGNESRNEREK